MNLSEINRFSIDTRSLRPGDAFITLTGPNFDGHDFVEEAEAKGAIAAIVEREVACDIPLIKVANTFHTLGELGYVRRQRAKIPIIALTGSCGKTTTRTMLASILALCGETLATEKNLNNNIGVPLTLLRLTPEHKFAVIEIGANQPDEIDYAAKLVRPDVAIITNVAPVHLEGFGTLDDVARIKGDILRWLTDKGMAILNADDQYFPFWCDLLEGKPVISFALYEKAEVMARDVVINNQGITQFVLQTPQGECNITLPVFGKHNVMNALAATAAALAVGVSLGDIQNGLETMQPVAGRLIKKNGINNSIILDDSYNANPESMRAAMQVLTVNPGEKILIVGDMAELGKNAERYHHEVGVVARELGVQKLYAVGDLTHLTVAAFGKEGYHFANRDELVASVRGILQPDVAVLIKGSRINRMWEIVAALLEQEEK